MYIDPAKTYAELKRGTNRVSRVFQGDGIDTAQSTLYPRWRTVIEVPVGVTVEVGYLYNAGVFSPPPSPTTIDQSEFNHTRKIDRALGLLQRQYVNAAHTEVRNLALLLVSKGVITNAEVLALGVLGGTGVGGNKTIDDLRADFKAIFDALP